MPAKKFRSNLCVIVHDRVARRKLQFYIFMRKLHAMGINLIGAMVGTLLIILCVWMWAE
jgi:hypothetical protein